MVTGRYRSASDIGFLQHGFRGDVSHPLKPAAAGGFSSSTGTYSLRAILTTTHPINSVDRQDFHAFTANAGDVLTLSTTTPGDGAGQPANDLDPILEILPIVPEDIIAVKIQAIARTPRRLYLTPIQAQGSELLKLYEPPARPQSTSPAAPAASASSSAARSGSSTTRSLPPTGKWWSMSSGWIN